MSCNSINTNVSGHAIRHPMTDTPTPTCQEDISFVNS